MRALAIKERLHGPDHPDVALTLHNLGLVYVSQGVLEKAEPLYRRALAIREQAQGETGRDVEKSLADLIGLLKQMHREADAAPLDARLTAIKQRRS